MQQLEGKKVAILVADGFEQVEMTEPRKALDEAGAQTVLVSPAQGKVKGWDTKDWGQEFPVDQPLDQAKAEDFDALLLPGGVMNPDNLRRLPKAQQLIKAFFDAGKPVAAICHGPWTLIDAGVAKGRKMTSYETIQSDLKNAGVQWEDSEVVIDDNLVTSRKPDDLPAFNEAIVKVFAKAGQMVGAGR